MGSLLPDIPFRRSGLEVETREQVKATKATSFSNQTSQVAVPPLLTGVKRLPLFAEVLDVNRKGWRLAFLEIEKALQLSW